MKNKEIHLRYLEEYMSYSSAMYGASMYLYDGKCSFKSCFELASKASFCTSCCCCSKCSSKGKIRQKKVRQKNSSKKFVKFFFVIHAAAALRALCSQGKIDKI